MTKKMALKVVPSVAWLVGLSLMLGGSSVSLAASAVNAGAGASYGVGVSASPGIGLGSYAAAAAQAEAENPLPPELQKCYVDAKDEHEQAACIWKEVELWDQRLNANYLSAMERCQILGSSVGNAELSELCAKQVKDAERKWLKYRDSMIEAGTYLAPDYFGVESQVQQAQYALDIVRNQALLLNKFHEHVKRPQPANGKN